MFTFSILLLSRAVCCVCVKSIIGLMSTADLSSARTSPQASACTLAYAAQACAYKHAINTIFSAQNKPMGSIGLDAHSQS